VVGRPIWRERSGWEGKNSIDAVSLAQSLSIPFTLVARRPLAACCCLVYYTCCGLLIKRPVFLLAFFVQAVRLEPSCYTDGYAPFLVNEWGGGEGKRQG
jgi:hypothetical protein